MANALRGVSMVFDKHVTWTNCRPFKICGGRQCAWKYASAACANTAHANTLRLRHCSLSGARQCYELQRLFPEATQTSLHNVSIPSRSRTHHLLVHRLGIHPLHKHWQAAAVVQRPSHIQTKLIISKSFAQSGEPSPRQPLSNNVRAQLSVEIPESKNLG